MNPDLQESFKTEDPVGNTERSNIIELLTFQRLGNLPDSEMNSV